MIPFYHFTRENDHHQRSLITFSSRNNERTSLIDNFFQATFSEQLYSTSTKTLKIWDWPALHPSIPPPQCKTWLIRIEFRVFAVCRGNFKAVQRIRNLFHQVGLMKGESRVSKAARLHAAKEFHSAEETDFRGLSLSDIWRGRNFVLVYERFHYACGERTSPLPPAISLRKHW